MKIVVLSPAESRWQPRRRALARWVALAALALPCFSARPVLAQAPKTLKIAHQFPGGTAEAGDFRDRLTRKFAAEVERRTHGQLKFEVFPNNSLFRSDTQFVAVQRGALDLTLFPLAYAGGEIPEVNLTLMPALITSYEQAASWKNAAIGKELSDILDQHGVKIITWIWQAGGIASSGQPVLVPGDVKGLKIRGAGQEMNAMLAAAGGLIANMPSSEVYNALHGKSLDAAVTSSTSLISYRLYESSRSVTTARDKSFWFMFEPLLMSKASYDALTSEQQSIVREVGASLEGFALEQARADDQELARVYEKAGVQVVDMHAEQFEQWRALAKTSAWAEFEKNVKNGPELMQKALSAH